MFRRPSREIAFSLCFLSSKEAALWGWTANRSTTTSHPTVGWFYLNSPSSKKITCQRATPIICSPKKNDQTTRPVATAAVRLSSWPVPSSVAQPKSERLAQVMTFYCCSLELAVFYPGHPWTIHTLPQKCRTPEVPGCSLQLYIMLKTWPSES